MIPFHMVTSPSFVIMQENKLKFQIFAKLIYVTFKYHNIFYKCIITSKDHGV